MKKYLVTSDRLEGEVELVYDSAGCIQSVNFSNAKVTPALAVAFLRCVSSRVEQVAANFSARTKIIEAEVEISFDDFWRKYKKKINRKRCETLWSKLSKTSQVRAFVAVDAYMKYLQKNDWRTQADPDTYLRNRYWENEY